MKLKVLLFIFWLISTTIGFAQEDDKKSFEYLDRSPKWDLEFNDDCTGNWQENWFLDGVRAEIKNSEAGMLFSAGPIEGDDACHAVLWTNESFAGDIKIEYSYTRTDARTKWVNILYIQATGLEPYARDISKWNRLRMIPYMKTYFTNMEALHISYAAYNYDNTDMNNDYIRVRRYPVRSDRTFTQTEVSPASYQTGLFIPGETYKITVIKTDFKLYFKVEGKNDSKLFEWDVAENQSVSEGRIGLRHMYTRSARYKNFKIFTKN